MKSLMTLKSCLLSATVLMLAPQFAAAQNRDLSFSGRCHPSTPAVSISFVGDILVHGAIYKNVAQSSKNFTQVWQRTNSLIQKADYSVANLEGPAAMGIDDKGRDHGDVGFIYDGKIYSGSNFVFNFHPRILSDLKSSGYDLLTLANNHTLDRYSVGVDKTVQAARQVQMPLVGVRHSQERQASFYHISEIQGYRIAFLGCTEATNGRADTKDQLLLCYKNPERVVSIIKELAGRSDVDAIFVMPHWGVEYAGRPDASQQRFARMYLEAGATAIIGSHPHVLQPWEKYVTKDGRETLIAYSLGNFVAWQSGLDKKVGVVVYVGLNRSTSGRVQIFGVGYTPTVREGYEVYTADNRNDVLKHASQFFGTQNRVSVNADLMPKLCQ